MRGPASAVAPQPIADLSAAELNYFNAGRDAFNEPEGVGAGLGPRFNLDSCGGCHAHPASGGTSPALNPQVALATAFGARNTVPSFITHDGPVREVRFPLNADGTPDGGVHALFVVSGRHDATGNANACVVPQEDFEKQVSRHNIIFRIPTPVFGAGLIEMIPDQAIRDNLSTSAVYGWGMGIRGHINRISGYLNQNGNDGTIARFG